MNKDNFTKLDSEIKALVDSGATGPKAWRKALNIAVKYNPKYRQIMQYIVNENAQRRKEQVNDYGTNSTKTMRNPVSIPLDILALFETVDPACKISADDRVSGEKVIKQLYQHFPEFRTTEKL